ncbi:hypothetical protein AB0H34_46395 [Saccharopolyspora shandongensis]
MPAVNGTARPEPGADIPLFVASCVFTKQGRAFGCPKAASAT